MFIVPKYILPVLGLFTIHSVFRKRPQNYEENILFFIRTFVTFIFVFGIFHRIVYELSINIHTALEIIPFGLSGFTACVEVIMMHY